MTNVNNALQKKTKKEINVFHNYLNSIQQLEEHSIIKIKNNSGCVLLNFKLVFLR